MTVRRRVAGGLALALVLVVTLMPADPQAQGRGGGPAQGRGGPLADLQSRVEALEQAAADLSAALSALGTDVAAGDATLQAQIDAANAELLGLQQLFGDLNTAVNNASADILFLLDRVAALEDALDDLGGGLTSYDQLAGLPCTTAIGTQSTINLVGLLKSPICAEGTSVNGRFIDFGSVILDAQTNLLWEKKKTTAVGSGLNFADLHDVDNPYDWFTATGDWINAVNAEVFAGFSNWRVPTRNELLTVVDLNAGRPRIDPIFGPTQAAFYWSATEFADTGAWGVNFRDGNASFHLKRQDVLMDGTRVHVRAVRSGS